VGAAHADDDAPDPCPAPRTGLALATINAEVILVLAARVVRIPIRGERRAAAFNAEHEDVLNGQRQARDLARRQRVRRAQRMDARLP